MFSFPSMEEACEGLLFDGGGKQLEIPLSGGLFEGFSGGLFDVFSGGFVMVF